MDLTLRELEDYLDHLYRKQGDDQGLFMKLIEEIGEVAEALNRRTGRKASGCEDCKEALAKELADVIHYTVAIAAVNNIDLTETIFEKDAKASIKYHHDRNLQDFIGISRK